MFTLTTTVKKEAEAKARELFGNRKSALSFYIEMILRNHLGMKQKNVED